MRARLVAVGTGIAAVGTKELRGRMRGPRSFVALTFYLALLAGFTVMIYLLQEQSAASQMAFGGGNPYLSGQVGQAVFTTLLFLQVLLVVFLAPAATTGAISLEREKQTLDLLTATPVSTLGIVLGKLASSLAFVVVLILASIPLTAVVFVFGGVAPEDILRGYLVLLVTAIGFGSLGIFFSSITRRTQSATFLTYLAVLALTVGTGFTWFFWNQMTSQPVTQVMPIEPLEVPAPGGALDGSGTSSATAQPTIARPPEALLWLNPVVAAVDVVCGIDVNPYSTTCQVIAGITGTLPGGGAVQPFSSAFPEPVKRAFDVGGGVVQSGVAANGGAGFGVVGDAAVAADEAFAAASTRDSFWPRSAAAWLLASVVLVLLSVQLVSPTRRWRLFRWRPRRDAAA
jgi:ABC-type transport system involved in multi-copper enzyme maturation permease subunit